MSGIAILGAGAFGTSLAVTLAAKGPVTLWARDAETVAAIQLRRENTKRLPGVTLPEAIHPTADLDEALSSDTLLLALPMQRLRGFCLSHADRLSGRALVACCKGIDLQTGHGPCRILTDTVPDATVAILTGPSFAADIARGLPTALTLAVRPPDRAEALQQALTTPTLRLYRTDDVAGAELGGALKNVVAIGAGIVMGAGLGASARAALMTRGYAELTRLAAALGAHPETLAGLSGLGDLILTCTSDLSRNYRHGFALGAGRTPDDSATVEGAATAHAALALGRNHGIDLPLTQAIVTLLDKPDRLKQVVAQLLSRPLKQE